MAGWGELSARAVPFDFHGRPVRAVDKQTLIDRKRARGSETDLADVKRLEALSDD